MPSVSGYDLINYGDMVRCEPRMSAFDAALRTAVTPGCTVIDLGAGPGVFSILACRYGAARVIAIEPDSAIGLLPQLARDNGYADRIEIFQGLSTDYVPTGQADVIVSDLRGGLPLFERHIEAIRDARARLLAPGGVLIPARDQLRIAAIDSPSTYDSVAQPWRTNAYDVDLSAGARYVLNSQVQVDLTEEALLGEPQDLATLDYRTIDDPDMSSTVVLPIARDGTVHGLLVWFDAIIADHATYSNAPGQPPQVYRQVLLPLEQPLPVRAGDRVEVDVRADLVDGAYVWTWNTSLSRAAGAAAEPCFRQSTFLSHLFQPRQLASRSDGYVPARSDRAAIDSLGLSLIDGERSLQDIATLVSANFPQRFASPAKALDHVTELVGRYARGE